jgi:hypothetical protein
MPLALLALALFIPAAAPPSGDGEILRLIERLGHDDWKTREATKEALSLMGRHALWRLTSAWRRHPDLTVRQYALELVISLDPAVGRHAARERARLKLLRAHWAKWARGLDIKRWGEDVPNPFTHVTMEGRKKLEAEGVDVAALLKMRAVMVSGRYTGDNSKTLANIDPDTIIVLGEDFVSDAGVFSAGPVLAVGKAEIRGGLTVAGPALFTEKSSPRRKVEADPLLAQPGADRTKDKAVFLRLVVGDFGWRRPPGWLDAPKWKAGAKLPPLFIDDAGRKRTALLKEVLAEKGDDLKDVVKPTDNPFKTLSEEGKARLRRRGVDVDRLARLKAVLVPGDHFARISMLHRSADIVLVLGEGFASVAPIYSAGPVFALGDADIAGPITAADVVWFADNARPRGMMRGLPVILTTTAKVGEISPGWPDTWRGDYGWKAKLEPKKR